MENSPTIGSYTASVLAIAAKGIKRRETVDRAYNALKQRVSRWASIEIERLEEAPTSVERQLAVETLIDALPGDEKSEISELAIALSVKLAETLPSAAPKIARLSQHKPLNPSWPIVFLRFVIAIILSISISWAVDLLLSPEREYLEHVQRETLSAVQSFRPWALVAAYNDAVMKDPIVHKTAGDAMQDQGFHSFLIPVVVLYDVTVRDFVSRPWPWSVVLFLQLVLGLFIGVLGIVKLRSDLAYASELLIIGIITTLPLHVVFLGSVAAIPLWLVA